MKRKSTIASRFRVMNTVLLILVMVLVALVFTALITGITQDASENYAKFYSVETVEKLGSYLNREIVLVQNVARSKVVRNWFSDENNTDKKYAAYNEMISYAEMLQIASLYFGVNESLNEYSVESNAPFTDFKPFDKLSPTIPYDSWYFYSLSSENEYTLNLDVDKISKTRRMWINCKVMENETPLGIFCSALQFDEMFKELFGKYDQKSVTGYIIDENGIIQMDSSQDTDYGVYENLDIFEQEENLHITQINQSPAFQNALTQYLSDTGAIVTERAEPQVIHLTDQGEYISVAPILNTNWSVVIFFNSSSLFSISRLTPLLVIMLLAFMLYFIANGSLIKNLVLNPLDKLTDSVSRAGEAGVKIYGTLRQDEIGALANMIENMFIRIKSYNVDLFHSTQEREKQALLLETVNNVAAALLAVIDDDAFGDKLINGIRLMAQCVAADRVFIWKNETIDGELFYVRQYEWHNEAGAQGLPIEWGTVRSYHKDIPKWESAFLLGKCINGPLEAMPPIEKQRLSIHKMKSILAIPVYLGGYFWGFVSFEDYGRKRIFTDDEVNILRSGSLMMINAILRNEMTIGIRQTAAKLETALIDAQAANQAKSSFLSNMSHEIRTPINAIVGMTAIGKAAANLDRKDYALEKIEGASNHLLGVINDVLDMSKIEAGKFDMNPVEFVFENMLRRVVDVISFRVDEKRQRFIVYLDKNIPRVINADDQRLAQVITNLLANSIKFTPENERIRLDIQLLKEENGICTIKTTVTDTGIGISAEQQTRLFDSFEQAEGSISRRFGGTGLGLAISKHIVESMGGRIWVESELGKGAKFIFTIEAARGNIPNVVTEDFSGRNIKILVIDPDPDGREAFTAVAEWIGVACDTVEGTDKINGDTTYDLCFIDGDIACSIMPDVKNTIVILMMSAADWSVVEPEARSLGAVDFITKPPFPSDVADCIKKLIFSEQYAAQSKTDENYEEVFKGKRVLLAEDIEINREIVISMLEPYGLEIDCAANGIIAVAMFEKNPDIYDLIFMDVQMPEMDGLEATKIIRAKGFDVPIIAMTANVFKEDIEKCMEAGMSDHVGKPFDFGELLEKIKNYLSR